MKYCINSSKVYCKFEKWDGVLPKVSGINSSKVYCKYFTRSNVPNWKQGINSSKVYCKCIFIFSNSTFLFVLIVAKCIVN